MVGSVSLAQLGNGWQPSGVMTGMEHKPQGTTNPFFPLSFHLLKDGSVYRSRFTVRKYHPLGQRAESAGAGVPRLSEQGQRGLLWGRGAAGVD